MTPEPEDDVLASADELDALVAEARDQTDPETEEQEETEV